MKFFLFIIFIGVLSFSCKNKKTIDLKNDTSDQLVNTDSIRNDIDTVQINRIEPIAILEAKDIGWEFDKFSIDTTICPKDTVGGRFSFQIAVVYPIHTTSSVNLEPIQKTFTKIVAQTDTIDNIQEAFKEVIDRYVNLKNSNEDDLDGETLLNNYYSLAVSARYISQDIITVSMYASSYEGGAHNIFVDYYYNIATSNGDVIDEQLLFVPNYEDSLAELIQKEIKRRNNLANESDHINLLGSLTDVKPNKNFYFENTGITYLYNVYEIAGFVYGPIEIHIPYDKIIPLVKEQYRPFIQSIQKEKIYELNFISSEDGVLQLGNN